MAAEYCQVDVSRRNSSSPMMWNRAVFSPQDCSMSFLLRCYNMLSKTLTMAYNYIWYRSDSSLFNLRRLAANSKINHETAHWSSVEESCLQTTIKKFSVYQPSSLSTCTHESTKSTVYYHLRHSTEERGLLVLRKRHLLRRLSRRRNHSQDSTGQSGIRKTPLQSAAAQRHRISTKLKVYNAVVLFTLLYGCETWTFYRRHFEKSEKFHLRFPFRIMPIKWQGKI